MTMQQVHEIATSADGTSIAYRRSGSGRPLVLVHGTTADHSRWRTLLPLLEPHVEVCAVDRRGRGASGDTPPYALEREHEDVVAVVEALAAEWGGPVDVFGHSYGALCCLEAAPLTTSLRALVLYEAPVAFDSGTYPPGLIERLEALIAEERRDEVITTFFREFVGVPEAELAIMRSLPAWQARLAAAHTLPREERATSDYRFDPGRFRALTVPTLLLAGAESPEFLQVSTEAVAEALPNATVAPLEGQQHVAMDTATELVAHTVLRFLAER